MQSQVPKLVVFTKGKPREIEMGQELTIGRGYSNLLRLEGDEISRVHAIIYRRNDDFIVRDLDSKNGVFLNGSKIAYAQLGPGDKLQVGKYQMVFDPPSGFDPKLEKPANCGLAHPNGKVSTEEPEDYTSSGHVVDFAPPPPPPPPPHFPAADKAPTPTGRLREEIYVLTRHEWQNMEFSEGEKSFASLPRMRDQFMQNLGSGYGTSCSLIQALLDALVKTLSADRGAVILRHAQTGALRSGAMVAANSDVAVNRVVLRSGLEEGKAILCPHTEDSGLLRENDTVVKDRISSLISVPLGEAEALGLLYVDRVGETDEFNLADFQMAINAARILELHLCELENAGGVKDSHI